MRKICVETIENPEWQRQANELVRNTYDKIYGLEYEALNGLLEKESKSLTIATIKENLLTSTLTIFEESDGFPSNKFFNFELPDFLGSSKTIEIGRLSKDLQSKNESGIKHLETIALLQQLMAYSKFNHIQYWQATLHPHLAHLLKEELEIPFKVLFKGAPTFSEDNKCFEQYMGSYLQHGIYYVWSDMQSSYEALQKWNLSEYINFEYYA